VQCGQQNDRRAMLVVMHDGDVKACLSRSSMSKQRGALMSPN